MVETLSASINIIQCSQETDQTNPTWVQKPRLNVNINKRDSVVYEAVSHTYAKYTIDEGGNSMIDAEVGPVNDLRASRSGR